MSCNLSLHPRTSHARNPHPRANYITAQYPEKRKATFYTPPLIARSTSSILPVVSYTADLRRLPVYSALRSSRWRLRQWLSATATKNHGSMTPTWAYMRATGRVTSLLYVWCAPLCVFLIKNLFPVVLPHESNIN
jgi:hypothetical protein